MAYAARELHVLCPYRRQPPGTGSALEVSAARSLPASGSDHAWAHTCSPEAMPGSQRRRCSPVPNRMSEGPRRKMPFWVTRAGAPAAQYSSSKISHSTREAPLPPYSSGQETTDSRAAASSASQARWAAKPSGVSMDGR
ncbi:hypothetical protein GCM10020001_069550 [Nonomuraea salmonea]